MRLAKIYISASIRRTMGGTLTGPAVNCELVAYSRNLLRGMNVAIRSHVGLVMQTNQDAICTKKAYSFCGGRRHGWAGAGGCQRNGH